MSIYITALILSTIAGLSTLVGGCVAFITNKNSMKMLSIGLGFSAGVMIYISLGGLLGEATEILAKTYAEKAGWITYFSFIVGIALAILIDFFIPDHIQTKYGNKENDDEEERRFFKTPEQIKRIKKAGLTTAIAVAIHNFPEGLTTFFATTADLKLGLTVVIAIAIHNIPEGIAIALPVYHATGSRRKAFKYCALSGLMEPLGGVIGFTLIHYLFPNFTIGAMFALIAGIMTYIAFDTLLPLSREYDTSHYSITGVVLGLLIMSFVTLCVH